MENNNQQVDKSVLLPILQQIPLFKTLNQEQHQEIIEHIVLMYYPPAYSLFKQGEQGDALYIIKKGQVEIYKEPTSEGEEPKNVATLTEGGFFGEMALVSEVPRNASAKTIGDCEIFILSKNDFKTLLNTNTDLAEQVSATMVSRLKENDHTQ